jgi:DNA-binding LacI/PurR family transcriptional regulator
MGSARLDDEAHLVESNDRQAVAAAVSHLIAQGHRRSVSSPGRRASVPPMSVSRGIAMRCPRMESRPIRR